jgi:hypothetical protein
MASHIRTCESSRCLNVLNTIYVIGEASAECVGAVLIFILKGDKNIKTIQTNELPEQRTQNVFKNFEKKEEKIFKSLAFKAKGVSQSFPHTPTHHFALIQ